MQRTLYMYVVLVVIAWTYIHDVHELACIAQMCQVQDFTLSPSHTCSHQASGTLGECSLAAWKLWLEWGILCLLLANNAMFMYCSSVSVCSLPHNNTVCFSSFNGKHFTERPASHCSDWPTQTTCTRLEINWPAPGVYSTSVENYWDHSSPTAQCSNQLAQWNVNSVASVSSRW